MQNDVKPTFVNIVTIDGHEVDIKILSPQLRAEIANQLNRNAMTAIGYKAVRTA